MKCQIEVGIYFLQRTHTHAAKVLIRSVHIGKWFIGVVKIQRMPKLSNLVCTCESAESNQEGHEIKRDITCNISQIGTPLSLTKSGVIMAT